MRVVAYCRYSSDNQRDLSIVAQQRAIEAFAARDGHVIVKTYTDEAKSATSDNRPAFLSMMREVPSGMFEAIVVHKLDRFARDRYDAAYYRKTMKKHGVRLLSVLENLDDSPESVMFEAILEGMAEYYSRNLSREVMKGMKESAYQCKHTGGVPPLGFDVTPDKSYVINEHEAEAVRIIYSMYRAGHGYSAILDKLNGEGYRTKTGNVFAKNSLHSVLTNEKYTGTFLFNRFLQKDGGVRNKRKKNPDSEIIRIENGMPQIIDHATWAAVREKMIANKNAPAANSARAVYLLSGKIFCGHCMSSMIGRQGKRGRDNKEYAYYECGARRRTRTCDAKAIGRDLVEGYVIDALKQTLFNPDVIDVATDQIFKYAVKIEDAAPARFVSLRSSIAAVDIEIRNMVNAVAAGLFQQSMVDKMAELELRKETIKAEMFELSRKTTEKTLSREEIKAYLSRWSNLTDPIEYRQAIKIFVERVIVYDDHVDLDIFTPLEIDTGGKVVPCTDLVHLDQNERLGC